MNSSARSGRCIEEALMVSAGGLHPHQPAIGFWAWHWSFNMLLRNPDLCVFLIEPEEARALLIQPFCSVTTLHHTYTGSAFPSAANLLLPILLHHCYISLCHIKIPHMFIVLSATGPLMPHPGIPPCEPTVPLEYITLILHSSLDVCVFICGPWCTTPYTHLQPSNNSPTTTITAHYSANSLFIC